MCFRFVTLFTAFMLAGLPPGAYAQERASNVLFYTHPAREWNQAMPLGNGRLGAMVFGNVAGERIQLNENSKADPTDERTNLPNPRTNPRPPRSL